MGGGGSQPAGNTTTTQTNIPFNSGYLDSLDNQVFQLGSADPLQYYGGQTLASPTAQPDLTQLSALGTTAAGQDNPYYDQNMALNTNYWNQNNLMANGQPIVNSLSAIGNGGATAAVQPAVNSLNSLSGNQPLSYTANATNGLNNVATTGNAVSNLANTANGAYLPGNGNSNPYLDATYNAAANPVINSFMTATSPRTDSSFEAAGRFNSGANNNAQSINQQALSQGLGTLSAGIYEPAYENERNRQVQAAAAEGGIQNTALANEGNITNTGLGIGTNAATSAGNVANTATANSTNALTNAGSTLNNLTNTDTNISNSTPALTQMPFNDLQTAINAENQTTANNQATLTDQANRYYGAQYAPYSQLATEANIIGGLPYSGGTSTTTSPYFTNPTGNALGTAGGVLGGIGSIAKVAAK